MAKITGMITPSQYDALNKLSSNSENNEFRKSQELDKDAFLKLMMKQLEYQDPLEPMDNSQYIAQMAQFSSVEQLSNIASSMNDNNSLVALMSSQLSSLSTLIENMSDKAADTEENATGDDAVAAQNKAILEQLTKLNASMEAYMSSHESDVSNEDILNAIRG